MMLVADTQGVVRLYNGSQLKACFVLQAKQGIKTVQLTSNERYAVVEYFCG